MFLLFLPASISSYRGPWLSFPDWRSRFRRLDLHVTSVTSAMDHGTGASDAEGCAASVLSLSAPSPLGPRRAPAAFVVGCRGTFAFSWSRNLARLLRFLPEEGSSLYRERQTESGDRSSGRFAARRADNIGACPFFLMSVPFFVPSSRAETS